MIIQTKINDLDIVITVDPAISERSTAARTAIIVAGISPYGKIFLLDSWAGRQGDPAKVIEQIVAMALEWGPRCIGIEMIAYQKALLPYMNREMTSRSKWWPIIELKPDRNSKAVEKKNMRILSMVPFFKSGQIHILRGNYDFIDEFESFPNGSTVDLLDAFSYAIRLLVPKDDSRKPALEYKLKALEREDPSAARYWRKLAEKRGELEPEIDEIDDPEDQLVGEDIAYAEFV